jgi:hypothetical protein
VRMKRVPKLAAVTATVDPAAGVLLLSCATCLPPVIAIPLHEPPHSVSVDKAAACLVQSMHEEVCFGHVRRKVITDPRLRTFFWQATGRTLYISRQFNSDETFANDGHALLCATASLHKVCTACSSMSCSLTPIDRSCTPGPTIVSCSLRCSSSGPISLWCAAECLLSGRLRYLFVHASVTHPCRTLCRLFKKRRGSSSRLSARTVDAF